MQLAKSSDATLPGFAVRALAGLVYNHHGNQSAAAAAGALPHLMQLTKSSDVIVQEAAVTALGSLVYRHHDNQLASATAGAASHLIQLTKSSSVSLQEAAVTALSGLVINHNDSQTAAAAAGARARSTTHLKGRILTAEDDISLKSLCVMHHTLKPSVMDATTNTALSPSFVERSHMLNLLMFLSNHDLFSDFGSQTRLHLTQLARQVMGSSAHNSRSLMTPLVLGLPYSSESLSLGEALARKNLPSLQDDGQGHVARAVTSLARTLRIQTNARAQKNNLKLSETNPMCSQSAVNFCVVFSDST
jgi:hypothetical protein